MSAFRLFDFETSKPIKINEDLPPYWLIRDPTGMFFAVFEDIECLMDVDCVVPHFKGFDVTDMGGSTAAFVLGYMQ